MHPTIAMPTRLYAMRDPETLEQCWFETEGMGEEYVRAADIAALIAAEREACAKVAEGNKTGDLRTWPHQSGDYDNVSIQSRLADAIAAAIRARSD